MLHWVFLFFSSSWHYQWSGIASWYARSLSSILLVNYPWPWPSREVCQLISRAYSFLGPAACEVSDWLTLDISHTRVCYRDSFSIADANDFVWDSNTISWLMLDGRDCLFTEWISDAFIRLWWAYHGTTFLNNIYY